MRKLATLEVISSINIHANADSLELATVRGWQVVVKKDEFKVGEIVVFFEIDSWIPTELAPFLSKGQEPREYEGRKGERLRTVRLRKELSQGLILPLSCLNASIDLKNNTAYGVIHGKEFSIPLTPGADLTDILGIIKWEPEIPAQLQGNIKGNFPSFFPKTDQDRCQNCYSEMAFLDNQQNSGIKWIIEEKIDGSSTTIYCKHGKDGQYDLGVCSRNFELKLDGSNADNSYVKTATNFGYLKHLPELKQSIAIQGELCGPGIQGNKYKLKQFELFVFDVYLIDENRYATRDERWNILQQLISLGVHVEQVPHLGSLYLPLTSNECLQMAEGKSKINQDTQREGIVFKTAGVIENRIYSFKAISNTFLLNEK